MGLATGEITLDPKAPVVSVPDSRPPKKQEKKRKPRSDKGKKRKSGKETKVVTAKKRSVPLTDEAKQNVIKFTQFDEFKISEQWKMSIWPCWNNLDTYEIRFVFGGVRYGYKQTFTDPTLAYVIGENYLRYRYQHKSNYVP